MEINDRIDLETEKAFISEYKKKSEREIDYEHWIWNISHFVY